MNTDVVSPHQTYAGELRKLAECMDAVRLIESTPIVTVDNLTSFDIPGLDRSGLAGKVADLVTASYLKHWPQIRQKALHDANVALVMQHEAVAKAAAAIGMAAYVATMHAAQPDVKKPAVTCVICRQPIKDGEATEVGGFGMEMNVVHATCRDVRMAR